jgi:hypothetical protein
MTDETVSATTTISTTAEAGARASYLGFSYRFVGGRCVWDCLGRMCEVGMVTALATTAAAALVQAMPPEPKTARSAFS